MTHRQGLRHVAVSSRRQQFLQLLVCLLCPTLANRRIPFPEVQHSLSIAHRSSVWIAPVKFRFATSSLCTSVVMFFTIASASAAFSRMTLIWSMSCYTGHPVSLHYRSIAERKEKASVKGMTPSMRAGGPTPIWLWIRDILLGS